MAFRQRMSFINITAYPLVEDPTRYHTVIILRLLPELVKGIGAIPIYGYRKDPGTPAVDDGQKRELQYHWFKGLQKYTFHSGTHYRRILPITPMQEIDYKQGYYRVANSTAGYSGRLVRLRLIRNENEEPKEWVLQDYTGQDIPFPKEWEKPELGQPYFDHYVDKRGPSITFRTKPKATVK